MYHDKMLMDFAHQLLSAHGCKEAIKIAEERFEHCANEGDIDNGIVWLTMLSYLDLLHQRHHAMIH